MLILYDSRDYSENEQPLQKEINNLRQSYIDHFLISMLHKFEQQNKILLGFMRH